MSLHFAIAIKKDDILGYVPVPVLLDENADESFYRQKQIIHKDDIPGNEIPDKTWIKDIVGLYHELDYNFLNKKYNKAHLKTNFASYMANVDKMTLGLIKKSIDLSKTKMFGIVLEHKPLLYVFVDRWSNVYPKKFISCPGDHAKVKFGFEKKKETLHYKLNLYYGDVPIRIKGSGIMVLTNKKPLIVFDGKLIGFGENTSFNGNKIKPFLTKDEIVVENRLQGVFFEKFVKSAVKEFEFDIKGFKLVETPVKMKAVLEIEENIFGKIIITPIFYYGQKMAFFHSKQKVYVDVVKKGAEYMLESIHRDLGLEYSMTSGLIEIGLEEHDKYYTYKPEITAKHLFIGQFNKIFPKIRRLGFKVENKLYPRKVDYSIPKLNIDHKMGHKKPNQKQDWFDMYITVKFGDFEIDFYKLKNHILNKDPEFELPDSSIAIIPDAWFAELNFLAKNVDKENRIIIQRAGFNLLKNNKLIMPKLDFVKGWPGFDSKKEVALPKSPGAILRDYQKEGFRWIYNNTKNNFGVCIADEMGLGKTLQVLTCLQKFYEGRIMPAPVNKINSPQLSLFDQPVSEPTGSSELKSSLIVLPRSLIFNWIEEIKKFAPDLSYYVYYGVDRKNIFEKELHKNHLLITTYGVVRQDVDFLNNFDFAYLVLDESHAIKNPVSKTYKAVTQLNSDYKISITGTPFENSLSDLWSQMNFLNDGMLGNYAYFKTAYIDRIMGDSKAPEVEDLRKLISPFVLRRLKQDVAKELPAKTEQVIYCKMEELQEDLYETEKSAIRNEMLFSGTKKNYLSVLAILNKLRQIALHPLLVEETSDVPSAKYEALVPFMKNLMAQGDKFLVFSSFVKHLNIYKKHFEENNIEYSMLTGSDTNRQQIVDGYNNGPQIKPFLISIKAGGVGLNITSANYVLIIDPWWNPFVEQQAIDRTHRIGQTNNVFVYRFIVKDTVEEKIIKLQENKRMMSEGLLDGASYEKIGQGDIEKLLGQ